jgi:signal transduction histidine kinase
MNLNTSRRVLPYIRQRRVVELKKQFQRATQLDMSTGFWFHRVKSTGSTSTWFPTMGKRIAAVWVALTVAMVATAYLFTFQEKLRIDLDRVAHIRETLSLVYDLENQLTEAEAGVRGYVLTGEERQLMRYQEAIKEIDSAYDDLYQQTADEPDPRRLLDTLKPLIKQRQGLFLKSIDLARLGGVEGPAQQAVALEGGRSQDRIRKILEKLEDEEKKQLNPEWDREKRKSRIIFGGLTFGTFASFTLLSLVIYFLNREINERKRVEGKVAVYQENLRSLASQLTLAEERERRRLAVDLHDRIGQGLALANIKLGELQKSVANKFPGFPTAELEKTSSLLEQAIRDTHSLTFKISSPILYELGLEAALEWLTEQIQEEYGIAASFTSDGQAMPLDHDVRILLFQAVSELLVNVVKHSQARNVAVSIWSEAEELKIDVDDNGIGFEVEKIGARWWGGGGFGLFSIRERLQPFGGRLEVKSVPGTGTRVTLTVPLPDTPASDNSHDH